MNQGAVTSLVSNCRLRSTISVSCINSRANIAVYVPCQWRGAGRTRTKTLNGAGVRSLSLSSFHQTSFGPQFLPKTRRTRVRSRVNPARASSACLRWAEYNVSLSPVTFVLCSRASRGKMATRQSGNHRRGLRRVIVTAAWRGNFTRLFNPCPGETEAHQPPPPWSPEKEKGNRGNQRIQEKRAASFALHPLESVSTLPHSTARSSETTLQGLGFILSGFLFSVRGHEPPDFTTLSCKVESRSIDR